MIWTDYGQFTTLDDAFDSLDGIGGEVRFDEIITREEPLFIPSNCSLRQMNPAVYITIPDDYMLSGIGTAYPRGSQGTCVITNKSADTAGQSNYTTIDENISVFDVEIRGAGDDQQRRVHGIFFQYLKNVLIRGCRFKDMGQANLDNDNTTELAGDFESGGIWNRNCMNVIVEQTYAENTDGIGSSLSKNLIYNNNKSKGG